MVKADRTLEASRAKARSAAARHSALVRLLKFALPVVAVVAAGGLALKAALFSYAPNLNLPSVALTRDGLTMVEPRVAGRSKDRAYEIVAARALQSFEDPKKVKLERIDGRVELPDKQWAKVSAPLGLYDGVKERLRLEGQIEIYTSNGYRFVGSVAEFDLDTGRMNSDAPVRIDGPQGSIAAGRLETMDNGRTIVFSGGVAMSLVPADRVAAGSERRDTVAAEAPADGSKATP